MEANPRAHADSKGLSMSPLASKGPPSSPAPESLAPDTRLFKALRARRKELGLTQQELADLAGVSTRFIHDLENAKATVQFDRLLAVVTTLGLELEWRVRQPGRARSMPR